jgi:hypothetical protein
MAEGAESQYVPDLTVALIVVVRVDLALVEQVPTRGAAIVVLAQPARSTVSSNVALRPPLLRSPNM